MKRMFSTTILVAIVLVIGSAGELQAFWQPGLRGGTVSGVSNHVDFPAVTNLYSSPHAAASSSFPPWAGGITWVYWGEMYFNGGTYHFAENMDDTAWLKIGETVYLNDGSSGSITKSGPVTVPEGWHYIEMRFGNGGGGAGAVTGGGWTSSKGFGYNIDGNDSTRGEDYEFPDDEGTMTLFRYDDQHKLLQHPVTGSTRFTNTNENRVVGIPTYDFFTHCQITEKGGDFEDSPERWIALESAAEELQNFTFTQPVAETNIVVSLWLTNLSARVLLIEYQSPIYYTKTEPTLIPQTSLTRYLIEGYSTVTLTGTEVDQASSGGTANGIEMEVYERLVGLASDEMPRSATVSLESLGVYEVELEIINEAGNSGVATSVVTVTEGILSTWSGGGSDELASTAANWSPALVPTSGDSILFNESSNKDCTWDLDIVVAEWQQSVAYSGTVSFQTLFPSSGSFTNFVIARDAVVAGGIWTHPANTAGATQRERLHITVGGDFTLGEGAAIDVDGKGYVKNMGPGAGIGEWGSTGRSATHGGEGAYRPDGAVTYGSIVYPEAYGSGAQGSGGGAVRLRVGGAVVINGVISARGVNPSTEYYCHGAGGSVLIEAAEISGSGKIDAGIDTSRPGYYGSGGGRIALHAGESDSFETLTLAAFGNLVQSRSGYGRAGTIFLQSAGTSRLIVDQGGTAGGSNSYTDLLPSLSNPSITPALGGALEDAILIITNGGVVRLKQDLRIGGIGWLDGTLALQSWTLYCKEESPPEPFPANYGNGSILPLGVVYTFDDGLKITRDGRVLWGDESVTWRVVTVTKELTGGTTTIDDDASEGYYAHESEPLLEALPAIGFNFKYWDGTLQSGVFSTENPLTLEPLKENRVLRGWFLSEAVDLQTNIWVSQPVNADWFDLRNWSLMMVPTAGQDVLLPAYSSVVVTNNSARLNSLSLEGGTITFDTWHGALAADEIFIRSGTVTHTVNSATEPDGNGEWIPDARVWFKCRDFTLEATATINVDTKGFSGGEYGYNGHGPGGGLYAGSLHNPGPGYGGRGGDTASPGGKSYGTANGGALPGSGSAGGWGQVGKNGGGAVEIEAEGKVTINGLITANGAAPTPNTSGGSGGGIRIVCKTIVGAGGVIRAEGVDSNNGSGASGGGRIAVVYDPEKQAVAGVPGILFSAYGGRFTGGPSSWPNHLKSLKYDPWFGTPHAVQGTLYFPDNRFLVDPMIHNGVWVTPDLTELNFGNLTVDNKVLILPVSGLELNVQGDFQLLNGSSLELSNSVVEVEGDLLIENSTLKLVSSLSNNPSERNEIRVAGDLELTGESESSRGVLLLAAGVTNGLAGEYGATLSVAGATHIGAFGWLEVVSHQFEGGVAEVVLKDLKVDADGRIDAAGKGFVGGISSGKGYGAGAGIGASGGGSGAGYGGKGGRSSVMVQRGEVYGDAKQPLFAGSGGGGGQAYAGGLGGRGGGLISIRAEDVVLHGQFNASATEGIGYGGGGAGGAIALMCNKLEGGGALLANGGNAGSTIGNNGGAGGGGRISVIYGYPYEVGLSAARQIVSESVPDELSLTATVEPGTVGYKATDPAEPGSIRFTKILPPPGSVIILR